MDLKQTDLVTLKKLAAQSPFNLIKIYLHEMTKEFSECVKIHLMEKELK